MAEKSSRTGEYFRNWTFIVYPDSAPKGKIQQISYFVKIRDFYNAFAHIDDLYKAWCAKTAIDNGFNGSI